MKKKKTLRVSLLVFFLVIVLSSSALSDGCFFGYRDLEEPSQVGVIVSERGGEDLILFVNAYGEDQEFAWVIPVPSYPTIEEGDSNLFYDLSYLTTYIPNHTQATCGSGEIVFAPGGTGNVHVWETMDVGIYETTILSADTSSALIDWLNKNGYTFPEGGGQVISYYIGKGYYFIAMKVKKEDSENPNYYMGIKPIHIHFSTSKIIYPLKISSISAADQTEVLLYIFDRKPWKYPKFSVEYSAYLKPEDYASFSSLNKLLNGKTFYLTKMRALLSPSDMSEDMVFSSCREEKLSFLDSPISQLLLIGLLGLFVERRIK